MKTWFSFCQDTESKSPVIYNLRKTVSVGWVCRSCIDPTLLPKSKIQIFKTLWRCHNLQNYFHQHSQVSVTMNTQSHHKTWVLASQTRIYDLCCTQQDKSGLLSQYTFLGLSVIKERWSRSSLHFIHSLMNSLKKQKIKNPFITFLRAHEPKFTPFTHFKALYSKS